jgi:hypothetical protein
MIWENWKHWIRFLPNVGEPFLARAKEIEDLNAKGMRALERRDKCEREVSASALGDWTEDEIREARVASTVANSPPLTG